MFPKILVAFTLASSFLGLVAAQAVTGAPCTTGLDCASGTCSTSTLANPMSQCLDLQSDSANCNSQGTTCGANSRCVEGQCRTQCGEFDFCFAGETCVTFSPTNEQCINLGTDTSNCGSLGTVCDSANGTATCNAGSCFIACNAGFTADIETGRCVANPVTAPAPNPSARSRAARMSRDLPTWF